MLAAGAPRLIIRHSHHAPCSRPARSFICQFPAPDA
jgi:hypothetical protein